MYIYNITLNIDDTIHDEWIKWMEEIHIPKVMATGKFIKALMSQVLVKEDMGGITYSVQFTCQSKELLIPYSAQAAPLLRKEFDQKYQNRYGAFRTEMKIFKEFS